MTFGWADLLKFLAPIAVALGIYFWAHDAGWKERDATVAGEISKAVEAGGKLKDAECKTKQTDTKGICDGLARKNQTLSDKLADALGSLHDLRHGSVDGEPVRASASGNLDQAGDNRLYYASTGAARTYLRRAYVASQQSIRLEACQEWIEKKCSQPKK